MNSMTGYGRGEATAQGLQCVVECTSVNRKGLEVACQLPRDLAALEAPLRDRIARRVARGRVNVAITLGGAETGGGAEIDHELARQVLADLRALQHELALPGAVDVNTLLAIPGIVRPAPPARVDWEPLILTALDAALDALAAMRAREGEALRRDLAARLATLRAARTEAARLAPEVVTRYREELRARLARAALDLPLDDTRLVTEIALFAERCDVSEELTRLDSHFAQFEEKLHAAEPGGRALEFLTQEIYRELNTLGSKAGDSALTRLVVASKVELDKIREQILNVE